MTDDPQREDAMFEQSERPKTHSRKMPVYNGDKMDQREFTKACAGRTESSKLELICGMVHEPPPVSFIHSKGDNALSSLLYVYSTHTPGTESGSNPTVILSDEDQLQPDSILRIQTEFGGQTCEDIGMLTGAPELIIEVALTSRAIDLHLKKERYQKFGGREYIVFCLEPRTFYWHHLQSDKLIAPGDDGISRSVMFPGLWVNSHALVSDDKHLVWETAMLGVQSAEHKAFCLELSKRKK